MRKSWTVEFLNDVVEAEFLAIPKDIQARLVRVADLIESNGLETLGMPYVRHLQGKQKTPAGEIALALSRAKEIEHG